MPRTAKRTQWINELENHYNYVQQAKLTNELDSEMSSLSDSDNGSHNYPANNDDDDPMAGIDAELAELEADLDIMKVTLEAELLDLDEDDEQPPSPTISEIEDDMNIQWSRQLQDLLKMIIGTRILEPQPPNPKSPQLHLLDHWEHHNIRNFQTKLRVHPTTFYHLLNLIEDHHIFHNNSNCSQLPVIVQFSIYLVRVGHYGNSSSVSDVAIWAGVSVGLVRKATLRVMIALIALHDKAVHLPTEDEKEASKAWVTEACCPEWRNGFLTVDGTKFPLFQRPGLHGDTWFDKNKDYSADCQVCFLTIYFYHLI